MKTENGIVGNELYFTADSSVSAEKPFVGLMGNISGGLGYFDDSRVLKDDLPELKKASRNWSLHPRFSTYKARVMMDLN